MVIHLIGLRLIGVYLTYRRASNTYVHLIGLHLIGLYLIGLYLIGLHLIGIRLCVRYTPMSKITSDAYRCHSFGVTPRIRYAGISRDVVARSATED